MFMKHWNGLFLSLCSLFMKWHFVLRLYWQRGGNVLLCCRDAANIKGGLEHLVSSIWRPPFTLKHTHTHTLSCSLISALVMKPPERELNTCSWQAGREGGSCEPGRLAAPPGSGPSLILAFHLFPILHSRAGYSLYPRLAADIFFFLNAFVPVCWWMDERRLFSPPSSLPACLGPALSLAPSPKPLEASSRDPCEKFNAFCGFCRSSL